jgi:hypothetical protein
MNTSGDHKAEKSVMSQSEPIPIIKQVIQAVELPFFVLCGPLAKFPLHFTDIHGNSRFAHF